MTEASLPNQYDLSGRQLGDYQLLRRLGQGGWCKLPGAAAVAAAAGRAEDLET